VCRILDLEDVEASMKPLGLLTESGSGKLGFACCIYDLCASD
jgi:hypothetical protein